MQVIPAIDVLNGRVVRLKQGDFDRVTEYGDDPQRFAEEYAAAGARRLHLVNLSGAKKQGFDGSFLNLLRNLASAMKIEIQVGGGIRTLKDVQTVLDAGATAVVLGTMVFKNPAASRAVVNLFGIERVIAALDVWGHEVRIQGWQQTSGLDLFAACQLVQEIGIREILVTDVARDGMGEGPNIGLYREMKQRFPSLRLIASGGIRGKDDIRSVERAACDAAVVGRALLDRSMALSTLVEINSDAEEPLETPRGSALAIRIIPCLDVANGRVVKGSSFQNFRDAGDPVELARRYCAEGADELVFLDIAASKNDRETAFALASRVADAVNIPFTIGGGIRSTEDARRILIAGADKVSVNSAAVEHPSLLSEMAGALGSANTVCAIDAKKKGESWTVLVRGGSVDTGIDAIVWAKEAASRGAGELLVTSYDQDGRGKGFDTELLRRIKNGVSVPVIASGGAGSLSSFIDAVRLGKADAVLAASVFHFGTFSIRDVKLALHSASYPVRL